MDNFIFNNEERVVLSLRALYGRYGYLPYKMSKFEEYELYVRNKDFLVSDSIITFNDTDGKLLALKPDVTLSIIKNYSAGDKGTQKLYYDEKVYRVSGSTHAFKEITQTGLECMGEVDMYGIFEVVLLALKSLEKISDDFVLDISHMGIVSAVVNNACDDGEFKKEVMRCIGEKNAHDISDICSRYGVSEKKAKTIESFVSVYGSGDEVLKMLDELELGQEAENAVEEIETLWSLISKTPYKNRVNFDFSIVNDMNYYNAFVFSGFVKGIPESVLAGGQYDKLMEKMGKKAKAIGFAVYVDLIEELEKETGEYDVDVLLLYDNTVSPQEVAQKTEEIMKEGKTVSAQRHKPKSLRSHETVYLTKGGGVNA